MKLPVNFGNKLFFRVVFPGAVFAAVAARASQAILIFYGLRISVAYAFPIETLLFGWLFLILDMPIYMLFEGRRFWPSGALRLGRSSERGRLLLLYRTMRRYDTDRLPNRPSRKKRIEADRIYLEAAVDISSFPLEPNTSMPNVLWPTRLGNLIAAYEQYPLLKYGLDAIFFWPRLWVKIDKDLREEIDNQQALADGLLYVTAALTAAAFLLIVYAVIDALAPQALMYAESPKADIAAAIFCLGSALLLYRVSLYSHSQYGELFKSVFDQHHSLLKLDVVVDSIANLSNDPGLRKQIPAIRNLAVWRFLRWHRVRLPGESRNRRVRTTT